MYELRAQDRIALTGATGFLGSALLRALFRFRQTRFGSAPLPPVRLLRRASSQPLIPEELRSAVEITPIALNHPASVLKALEGVDVVIHCAALVSFLQKDFRALYQTNVKGTGVLIDAALKTGVKRFLHVSSTAAIGNLGNGLEATEVTQFQDWQKRVGYMYSKYLAEFEVLRGVSEGLNATIINPGVIIGDCATHLNSAAWFVGQIARGEIPYYPTGGVGIVGLEDTIRFALAALEKGNIGERMIIIGDNLRYQDLFSLIYRLCGRRSESLPLSYRIGMVGGLLSELAGFFVTKPSLTLDTHMLSSKDLYYSNEKSRSELALNYTPREVLFKTILATCFPRHFRERAAS